MLILDRAAYASRGSKVDTAEVRLALTALWLVLRDRTCVEGFWEKACKPSVHPWESCRDDWYGIAATLRSEGWYAPIEHEWIALRDAENGTQNVLATTLPPVAPPPLEQSRLIKPGRSV